MNNRKILIADDDRGVLSALSKRLSSWGYKVVRSNDGLGVLALCLREGVDAIILDHEMPNGDGRSVAHIVRNETDIPIIFLSGHKSDVFTEIVDSLPDVYYLSKPLDANRLHKLLEMCVPLSASAP